MELFEAGLCRSQQLRSVEQYETADGGSESLYSWRFPSRAEMEAAVAEQGPEYPVAYRIEYNDGTRATMLLMTGLVGDFNFAARLHGCEPPYLRLCASNASASLTEHSVAGRREEVLSTLMNNDTIADLDFRNFGTASLLMANAEHMFTTGEAPWPIERNLLTTGLVEAGVRSLAEGGRLMTPQLGEVRYAVDDRQRWGGCYGEPAF